MTVFVDTSALYAILAGDDPNHAEAANAFASLLEHDSLVTTNYVVVEAVQLVRRRLGADAVADLFDRLLPSIAILWIDEPSHRAAVAALRAADGKASLVDHASFVALRAARINQVLAFDRDFAREGFEAPDIDDRLEDHRLSESRAPYEATTEATFESTDLVSVTELASRAGRSINTIQSWRRRRLDFPKPVAELAAGPIWRWTDIEAWIDARPPARTPLKPGIWKGKVVIGPDFDNPLREFDGVNVDPV